MRPVAAISTASVGCYAWTMSALAGLTVGLFVAVAHVNGTRRKLDGGALCLQSRCVAALVSHSELHEFLLAATRTIFFGGFHASVAAIGPQFVRLRVVRKRCRQDF